MYKVSEKKIKSRRIQCKIVRANDVYNMIIIIII